MDPRVEPVGDNRGDSLRPEHALVACPLTMTYSPHCLTPYFSIRLTVYSSRLLLRTTATCTVLVGGGGTMTGGGAAGWTGGLTASRARASLRPRSCSVTRRPKSARASSGRRRISDSLPMLVASKSLCACSGVASTVTALATVGCSCRSLAC